MADRGKVRVEDMAKALKAQLDEYAAITGEEMREAVLATGKDVKAYIKKVAPKHVPTDKELKYGKYRTRKAGKYAGSFTVTTTESELMATEVAVHSRTQYMLTHLLENGHAIVTGGRTKSGHYKKSGEYAGKSIGRVQGIPHLEKADELARQELMEKLEKLLTEK